MGFLDTGGNVTIVWIWGSEVGPYMQSLHFWFGNVFTTLTAIQIFKKYLN